MKRIVFSLVLFLGFAASVSAQEPTAERIKPAGGDFGLGFKITGLSNVNFSEWDSDHFAIPQLLGRYYISDKFALRARLGLDMTNLSSHYDNTTADDRPIVPITADSVIDTRFKTANFSLFPGLEYHLASPATKMDPYVGVELGLSYIGKTTDKNTTKINTFDATSGAQLSNYFATTTIETPGGIGFGGNAILGFNYFFSDNFAIGAEYTIGTTYTQVGGLATKTITGTQGPGTNFAPIDVLQQYQTENSAMNSKVRSTGGVNISIFW